MTKQSTKFVVRVVNICAILGGLALAGCTGVVSPELERLDLQGLDATYNPCTKATTVTASMVTEHIHCLAQVTKPRVAVANFRSEGV